VDRLDIDEFHNPMFIEPSEEIADTPVIGHAGVLVADRRGKEFQKTARRVSSGIGDGRWHGE
jgi:hypothetical protein